MQNGYPRFSYVSFSSFPYLAYYCYYHLISLCHCHLFSRSFESSTLYDDEMKYVRGTAVVEKVKIIPVVLGNTQETHSALAGRVEKLSSTTDDDKVCQLQ